jgi:hypothetical protein
MSYRLDQQSTAAVLASLLAASLCLLGACGGRSRTVIEPGDDTTPSAGASSAGAPGVGHAGAPGGGATAVAGASSSPGGGANRCDNVKCGIPECAPDSKLVIVAGSCCPICQPACTPAQGCPAIGCGPGTHSETLAGACCPVCVDDPGVTCDEGLKGYAEQRAQLLQKYEFGCASDAECVVLAPSNLCENGCQYAAVWYGAADFFTSNLANYADMNCASCMMLPIRPCDPPQPARCVMGQCMFPSLK